LAFWPTPFKLTGQYWSSLSVNAVANDGEKHHSMITLERAGLEAHCGRQSQLEEEGCFNSKSV
jgi:hypothetical protein